MNFEFEIPMAGFRIFSVVVGSAGLAFGLFSAFWPIRSIAFYERLMARLNWQVRPIDEAREIRNTRMLGWLLIGMNLALLVSLLFY